MVLRSMCIYTCTYRFIYVHLGSCSVFTIGSRIYFGSLQLGGLGTLAFHGMLHPAGQATDELAMICASMARPALLRDRRPRGTHKLAGCPLCSYTSVFGCLRAGIVHDMACSPNLYGNLINVGT